MKNQKGITLIALVVTIVVLLILAGITITYVMSEGGIFNTAKRAASETEVGAIKDYVTSAISDLSVFAYADGVGYPEGTTPTEIFEASFPSGSTISAGTVNAEYNAGSSPALAITILNTEVKLPGSSTTYNVAYSNGTTTVAPQPITD